MDMTVQMLIRLRTNTKQDETFDIYNYSARFECGKCGWENHDTYGCDEMKFCAGCGRKIVKVPSEYYTQE